VLFTLKRVRDNTKLIKAFVYQDIDEVRKDDDYTVTVTTKRPFGSLPAHLTMLGMLPPGAAGNEDAFFGKRWAPAPSASSPGRTAITSISRPPPRTGSRRSEGREADVRFIPELSTRAAALRAGEIHVIDRVWPDMVQTLKATPGIKVLDTPAVEAQRWHFQLAREAARIRASATRCRWPSTQHDHQGAAAGLRAARGEPDSPGLIGHTNLGQKPYDRTRPRHPQAGRLPEPHAGFRPHEGPLPKQLEIAQAVAAMLSDVASR